MHQPKLGVFQDSKVNNIAKGPQIQPQINWNETVNQNTSFEKQTQEGTSNLIGQRAVQEG